MRIDRMIKETTQFHGMAICDFDELTHDVLRHRILKATLLNLAACSDLEKEVRHDLLLLTRRFHDVADIRLSSTHFRWVEVSRNSRDYIFLMKLCEFVFWSLMPDEHGTTSRFQQVLDDEVRMSAVFEDFLKNFFQFHRTNYRVRSEAPKWHVSQATEHDLALLPRMLTDITLRHPDHTIIADAKFYRKTLAHGSYGERLHSQHLYQLITYLQHERFRDNAKPLIGMLIYPDVGRSLRLRYRLLGIPVLVCTVDLARDWQKIEVELLGLLDECATVTALEASGVPPLSVRPKSY
jgi:5-methylcytosine-specific restriction enzyme subunit McrC